MQRTSVVICIVMHCEGHRHRLAACMLRQSSRHFEVPTGDGRGARAWTCSAPPQSHGSAQGEAGNKQWGQRSVAAENSWQGQDASQRGSEGGSRGISSRRNLALSPGAANGKRSYLRLASDAAPRSSAGTAGTRDPLEVSSPAPGAALQASPLQQAASDQAAVDKAAADKAAVLSKLLASARRAEEALRSQSREWSRSGSRAFSAAPRCTRAPLCMSGTAERAERCCGTSPLCLHVPGRAPPL